MIKILILDDSREKTELIRKFLMDECHINGDLITCGATIKDGRKILYSTDFDLMLLDLVMPRELGSDASAEESIRFIEEIYYNSQIHIPVHIIGFSQHINLVNEHNEKFEDRLWHLINFDYTNNEWKDKLKNKVCHLVSVKERFKEVIENKYKFDIGIICALESPELKEILNLPLNWKDFKIENDPFVYHEGTIQSKKGIDFRVVACSINKMGMQAAASLSSMMISKFSIKQLFMVGICAGVRERNVNYGDIIISESTLDYGTGKMHENSSAELVFSPEPHQLPTDQNILSNIHNFLRKEEEILKIQSSFDGEKPNNLLKAHVGPIASGSYVVSSSSFVKSIIQHNRKLIGIDMEGYGVYLACHFFSSTKALFIKSVSDYGDEKKDDRYQKYASYTSARFLYSFLTSTL